MATNYNVYVNYIAADSKAKLQNAAGKAIGKITLEYKDTLTVHPGSGFSGTTAITGVDIFVWVNGAKGDGVGSWSGTDANIGVLSIGGSGTSAILTDNDSGDSDADYGYGVWLTATKNGVGTPYYADPELVAKKKRNIGTLAEVKSVKRRPPEAGA